MLLQHEAALFYFTLHLSRIGEVAQDRMMQRMSAENSGASAGTTNLGALLKAKLDNKNQG